MNTPHGSEGQIASEPIRIGVILAPDFQRELAAFKYLIVYQNTIQRSIEFLHLPFLGNHLRSLSKPQKALDREDVEGEMKRARLPYLDYLRSEAAEYGVEFEQPDGVAIVSMATFSDNFFVTWEEDWAIIALGNWKRFMAPPSMLEFVQSFLVSVAVDVACEERWPPRHFLTKGCLFDFSANLDDARLGVLTGFICRKCRQQISEVTSEGFLSDIRSLAEVTSLGNSAAPSHVALLVKKLGFDLFRTKGVRPTVWERIRDLMEEEALKTAFNILGTVLIAVLLLWLGLREAGGG